MTAAAHQIVTGAYAMLYREMDRAQLDAAYNNSAAVPERDAIVADWAARSARVRREYVGRLELASAIPRASGSICFSPPIRKRRRLRLSTAAIGR